MERWIFDGEVDIGWIGGYLMERWIFGGEMDSG